MQFFSRHVLVLEKKKHIRVRNNLHAIFFFPDMFRFTKTKYTCIHVVRRSMYICTYTWPHMGGFNAVIASCEVPFAIIQIV